MGKGSLTKEHIVAKAASVFNQSGFAGTSLSDVMSATGLQKGGIYRHFNSKEELAAAAFDYAWERAWNLRWKGIEKAATSIDQLRQFVANFVNERGGQVRGGCPVLNTAVDSDDGNLILRDRVRKALGQLLKRIEDIVRTGILKAEIRKDVDPQATAIIMISTLEGAIMIGRLQHSALALELTRKHLEGFLESLAMAGPPKTPSTPG